MRSDRLRKTRLWAGALAVCASLIVIACSGGDNPAASGPTTTTTGEGGLPNVDAGGSGDATTTADADGGTAACTVPPLGGATITAQVIAGSPPADTGGAFGTGTYDLTALEIYVEQGGEDPDGGIDAGMTMDTAQATFVLTSDGIALSKNATPLGGGPPLATTFIAKYHTSDVFLFTDETCPGTDSRQTPFTATATTIALHTAQLRREVYTRRP
jgi:hypothetical protein